MVKYILAYHWSFVLYTEPLDAKDEAAAGEILFKKKYKGIKKCKLTF